MSIFNLISAVLCIVFGTVCFVFATSYLFDDTKFSQLTEIEKQQFWLCLGSGFVNQTIAILLIFG